MVQFLNFLFPSRMLVFMKGTNPQEDTQNEWRRYYFAPRIYEMRPTLLNGKDDTLALRSTQCWVEMSISGTFVTNVSLMDYMLS